MSPGTFSIISGSRPHSVGGGGSSIYFCGTRSITFPQSRDGFFYISGTPADHPPFRTLTEIQVHLAGLLTHSKNVTTSIHWRQKHLPNVWGGPWPQWPPWLRHWCSTDLISSFLAWITSPNDQLALRYMHSIRHRNICRAKVT